MKAYAKVEGTHIVEKIIGFDVSKLENVVEMPLDKALSSETYEYIQDNFVLIPSEKLPEPPTTEDRLMAVEEALLMIL